MRILARADRIVGRRLQALTTQVPLARGGDPEAIHQARVASRRLREAIPLADGVLEAGRVRQVRHDIRTVTRALGPVRELDVALETLAACAATKAAHLPAIRTVDMVLRAERRAAFNRLQQELTAGRLERVSLGSREATSALGTQAASRHAAGMLAARLRRRGRELGDALQAVGHLYAAGPLHAARIALKKLRYALEVAEQLGRFRLAGSLVRLKQVQEVLGELHDLQVLAGRVRDVASTSGGQENRVALAELSDDLDRAIRRLHVGFLQERHRLAPVLARIQPLCLTLGVLPVRMAAGGRGLHPRPVVRIDKAS